MSLRSDGHQWGSVAKFFHWIVALGILGNGVWGLLMTDMAPSMSKISIYALHKSIGLTILALFALRLAWRLYDRAPPDEPMPPWQRIVAHATHVLLYGFILAIPLSGWIYNSLHGYPLQWFKLFNLPALTAKNDELSHVAGEVHEWLFYLLLLVLIGHAGAALKHHFFDQDNVLRRMLPFARVRQGKTSSGELT
ncbi:cytochrome b [Dyella acidisoli]|uniref:Cytochrome b n=1 Tax=Dyella acidisoli TaxID=1867834 RepID=A0ABQ5XPB8_9GAMM|nr:cytochrome b [Dyella acidisoli]GLQ92370.1 cytochrome b [Dyella acidisoli]